MQSGKFPGFKLSLGSVPMKGGNNSMSLNVNETMKYRRDEEDMGEDANVVNNNYINHGSNDSHNEHNNNSSSGSEELEFTP